MRRAAMAMATAALVLGGSMAAGCGPAASQRLARPAGPQQAADRAVTGTRTVRYGGYVIYVPAAWPVYQLAARPHLCVRYDRHAVYLGRPGPDQQCPAHVVGRTEAVRIDSGARAAITYQRGGAAIDRAPRLPAQRRVIMRDAADRELGLIIRRPALSVTATYANDPAVAERIIGSVRLASPAPPGAAAPGAAAPGAAAPSAAPRALARAASRAGAAHLPIAGFDTCAAPSIRAMRAWRPFYAAVAIYIGGANRACDQVNLSALWVRRVKAMGWSLIPTYVGLQPPCDRFGGRIRPKRAASEGAVAAVDAVALARGLHLRRHAPIYFDMEGYPARKRCRRAVLTFLDAWTRRLRARGYTSGVYSSAASGAQDLGSTRSIGGHPLARPETIWFALWDGHGDVRGEPYLAASWWPAGRRIKQFRGGRWQRHGGFRLNIDRDEVFGSVY